MGTACTVGRSVPLPQCAYDRRRNQYLANAFLALAAQGITHSEGLRTAPSAGALYPLEVYLVAGRVATLPAGIYRYDPRRHQLVPTVSGDRRRELTLAALHQSWIADAPAVVVIAAVFRRTSTKYGGRGERYVHIEAGHAAENVCLQAVALGLGTTIVGAFSDAEVKRLLGSLRGRAALAHSGREAWVR